MRLNKLIILLLIAHGAFSQESNPQKGDFQFPIRPNQENYLSGTVGELRSTHFHTGIDIKTSGITGLSVYAAADGYVQRIRVSTAGYGNALYVFHPQNNTVTVYAHLKYFDPAIATYIRTHQYEKESFEVNLFPEENQFVFKKGDVIAKSGNSGSSSGPHLHFEVRTKDHKVLDPLLYGFDEIDDTTPPILEKVAFVTMDAKARINGAFGRFEFDVIENAKGELVLDNAVYLQGKIGVEVYAFDRFDRARNRNGVTTQTLVLDNKPVFRQSIDYLNFSMSRSILIHTNYQRSTEGGRRFNKYYVDNGNSLNFYETNEEAGVIHIKDPLKHNMGIRLADSYGNIVQYNFDINGDEEVNLENKIWDNITQNGFEISGNYLELQADLADFGYCEAKVYKNATPSMLQMAYDHGDVGFYIWDLRKGLPDSIRICNNLYEFDFAKTIYPDQVQHWRADGIALEFPKRCLFDTTHLRFQKLETASLEVFQFSNGYVPVNQNFTVKISPKRVCEQAKTHAYAVDSKGRLSFMGGIWKEGTISFKARDFTGFTLATDSIPPTITALKTKAGQLKFKVNDDMSGIKSFKAELDGDWLLMNYDAKYKLIWSDEEVVVSGKFKVEVEDNCGNGTVFEKEY